MSRHTAERQRYLGMTGRQLRGAIGAGVLLGTSWFVGGQIGDTISRPNPPAATREAGQDLSPAKYKSELDYELRHAYIGPEVKATSVTLGTETASRGAIDVHLTGNEINHAVADNDQTPTYSRNLDASEILLEPKEPSLIGQIVWKDSQDTLEMQPILAPFNGNKPVKHVYELDLDVYGQLPDNRYDVGYYNVGEIAVTGIHGHITSAEIVPNSSSFKLAEGLAELPETVRWGM